MQSASINGKELQYDFAAHLGLWKEYMRLCEEEQ